MYADREEADSKRSIKERLNGNTSFRDRRQVSGGKRQRQDDKWEHDLYDDEPQLTNRKAGDLRLKLQRKIFKQTSGTRTVAGVRDLRERLSGGTMKPQPAYSDPPRSKVEAAKPARRNTPVAAPAPETHKVATPTSRKKASRKVGTSVDEFLASLDLDKYSILFQAEEVDMTALMHMTDEDLKVLGIPMGPRKKILLAMESRV